MEKILVVDDSKTIRTTLANRISQFDNLEPLFAANFQEAIQIINREKGQVFAAILDLVLPDAPDGEVVDFFLSYGTPSIVLTSSLNDKLRQEILQKPIIDYILKSSIENIHYSVDLIRDLIYFMGKKTLVIDDSGVYRSYLRHYFQNLMFEVLEAKDGVEGLQVLEKNQDISIVTVDYNMPKMDGITFIQEAKKQKLLEDMAVIAITEDTSRNLHSLFLKTGTDDYLNKPFTKEEFNARIIKNMRTLKQLEEIRNYNATIDRHILSAKLDPNGTFRHVSEALCRVSGYGKEELIGQNYKILIHPDSHADSIQFEEALKTGETWRGELKSRTHNGGFYWEEIQLEPANNHRGELDGFTTIRIDITDKKHIEELSITDPMTKLYNRRFFGDLFPREISRTEKENLPIALIVFDVDKFKQYNDHYGHQMGDEALISIGHLIKNVKNIQNYYPFRLGGEEFGIVLSGFDSKKTKMITEKIRGAIEKLAIPHAYNPASQFVTASFGICIAYPGAHASIDKLYKIADEALYLAKKSGRNRVEMTEKKDQA